VPASLWSLLSLEQAALKSEATKGTQATQATARADFIFPSYRGSETRGHDITEGVLQPAQILRGFREDPRNLHLQPAQILRG
jgi:hypothetical protein